MEIVLIGGGGFAGEVLEAISAAADAPTIRGFYDDDTRFKNRETHGLAYLGTIADYLESTAAMEPFVLAIGAQESRERLGSELAKAGKSALSVIHPKASVNRTARLADGAYVAAFAFVGPRAALGAFALVNVSASVGHDAKLGDFVQLCPGARVSGYCCLGRSAFCGSNSGLAPNTKMGDRAKLAAGSFAFRDVGPGTLAVGVPAKVVG